MVTARGKGDTPHRHLGGCAPASLQLQLNFSLLLRLSTLTSTTRHFNDERLQAAASASKSLPGRRCSTNCALQVPAAHSLPRVQRSSPLWSAPTITLVGALHRYSCRLTHYFDCASTSTDFELKLWLQLPPLPEMPSPTSSNSKSPPPQAY